MARIKAHDNEKKFCVFSSGKTTEKWKCFSSKIYLAQNIWRKKVCDNFEIFEEIYIYF